MDPRVKAALQKIEQAQHLILHAMHDLSPVDGYADQWTNVGRLHDRVKEEWHRIEQHRPRTK